MRRITVSVAVALCVLGVLAAPALAKEKIVFGEFKANIVGQNLETTPGVLKLSKEGEIDITGLQIGSKPFGPIYRKDVLNGKGEVEHKAGSQNVEEPCKKIKLQNGIVNHESSSSLTFNLKFIKCIDIIGEGTAAEEVPVSFTLGVTLESNFSAEVGKSESELKIEETEITVKPGLKKCPIVIPAQTIPVKDNAEKEYEEIVEYSNEGVEPEGWEHSKKLKELYPSGEKQELFVEFGEKFKHIVSYQDQEGPCTSTKGEEDGKVVTEGPHKGWLEYTTGHMFGDIENLEVKNGNISFIEP